jgi:hypothetical protein
MFRLFHNFGLVFFPEIKKQEEDHRFPDEMVGQLGELPEVEPGDGAVLAEEHQGLGCHLPVCLACSLLQRWAKSFKMTPSTFDPFDLGGGGGAWGAGTNMSHPDPG